ncbi:1-deoxy-D-xylulose-5-phosphate synthase [Saccharothrix australiensis]|uniref:1-deoxy-D-xylulose-5-phosphate synthase n=1 Tax=Saccharothrix australiensis TaxID=2072 RepID=A0A495W0B6_9PSEU|nr:1-deoxy-D-xylulose-5-phosphate synthase [Saccharothrix australiensis]RKT54447.1 1-deoxy-D-xylulose-5-phosphate synthase [Saccharothrix australiensis]
MTTSPAVRPTTSVLAGVDSPADLRALPRDRLASLAEEIRLFLVDRVSRAGGHLGPNLGVVELTIALHRVFDSPSDRIVFDTGHQAYVHKILTGRRAGFGRLRQGGGLSGYPSRSESDHDAVENSHASTALSYADGLARGFALRGQSHRRVVAVVGDGALTGGMGWEALNNLGTDDAAPVIVVLNDNGRSYAPTRGGLARHLAELRRAAGDRHSGPNLFQDLGLAYLGPVDGHDVDAVEAALRRAAALGCPVVVHCVTVKGQGYAPAETDEADRLHAVGVVDPRTGRPTSVSPRDWTSVFAERIVDIGRRRPEVVAITAAMLRPTGLLGFSREFPDRVFDVGIAEQHAVTSAAGLAMAGLHPVVAVYATFLNRAFDQVLMDVALHRLPVTFVLDRAGVTGPDGASHHGVWDLSLLAAVPGLRVAVPRDAARLATLLDAATATDTGPTALRFPKGAVGADIPAVAEVDGIDVLRTARDARVLLTGLGPLARVCLEAAELLARHDIGATVVDPLWAVPLNPCLPRMAAAHELTVTVEDNVETGGFGARLAHQAAASPRPGRVRTVSLPHAFLPHDSRDALLARAGLDARSIVRTVLTSLRPGTADLRGTAVQTHDRLHPLRSARRTARS